MCPKRNQHFADQRNVSLYQVDAAVFNFPHTQAERRTTTKLFISWWGRRNVVGTAYLYAPGSWLQFAIVVFNFVPNWCKPDWCQSIDGSTIGALFAALNNDSASFRFFLLCSLYKILQSSHFISWRSLQHIHIF